MTEKWANLGVEMLNFNIIFAFFECVLGLFWSGLNVNFGQEFCFEFSLSGVFVLGEWRGIWK